MKSSIRKQLITKPEQERINKMIHALCDFYGGSVASLMEKGSVGPGKVYTRIRAFIMYKLVKEDGYSISAAGRAFGRTAWAGSNSIEWMKNNKEVLDEMESIVKDL